MHELHLFGSKMHSWAYIEFLNSQIKAIRYYPAAFVGSKREKKGQREGKERDIHRNKFVALSFINLAHFYF